MYAIPIKDQHHPIRSLFGNHTIGVDHLGDLLWKGIFRNSVFARLLAHLLMSPTKRSVEYLVTVRPLCALCQRPVLTSFVNQLGEWLSLPQAIATRRFFRA